MRYWLLLLSLLLGSEIALGQRWLMPSDTLRKDRALAVGVAQGGLYTSTLVGLQFAWYQNYQSGGFRFKNDWSGWLQMDKVGHAATAYQISHHLYTINRWAGINSRKSMWAAAGLGYSYQLAVEVMDGFSDGWGFSNYDLMFNTIGTGGFLAQQLTWNEQRIKLKYSYFPSDLLQLNNHEGDRARSLFGTGIHEQWLKDYNGQTYWASFNLWSLTGKSEQVPKWINVAVGYSVNNLLGAEQNQWTSPHDPDHMLGSDRIRQRQWLLSLDIDLEHADLPVPLRWMRPVFSLIKVPFPALEWNSELGLRGHWFYL